MSQQEQETVALEILKATSPAMWKAAWDVAGVAINLLRPPPKEPTAADLGVIDPDLPGFDIPGPQSATAAWREDSGLV